MEVDFTDMGTDDLDAGGSVIPGYYRAIVAETKDNQFTPGNVDVEFHVTHGPFKGSRVWDTIIDPNNSRDTDAAKRCKQRLAMYLTRSGLFTKEDLAGKQIEPDWSELVGKECFIKVVEDNYEKSETDGTKTRKQRMKPAFDGFYALDDERVPEDVRKKNGVTAKPKPKDGDQGDAGKTAATQPKAAAGGGSGKRKVDTSKL